MYKNQRLKIVTANDIDHLNDATFEWFEYNFLILVNGCIFHEVTRIDENIQWIHSSWAPYVVLHNIGNDEKASHITQEQILHLVHILDEHFNIFGMTNKWVI